jgi:alpha-L-fucosidase
VLTGVSFAASLAFAAAAPAPATTPYVPPTDRAVREKLVAWQDLKFGLMLHWGTYSQWGVAESWTLCPEDLPFIQRTKGSNPKDYFTYKREYEALSRTFNPVGFNPATWAEEASRAGMRYVVFTTKHHDGFAMFDTAETDYKITAPTCPFSRHPHADVTRAIFDAFRREQFWIGAYYSKPDWHSPDYWAPEFPPFDRNVNYDPTRYPERWERFVGYTHRQIMELMSGYGPIDLLWLDGGWVRPRASESTVTRPGFWRNRAVSQDVRLGEVVARARTQQPGLIVVDRGVPGVNQDYLTPENRVPAGPLPHPWEVCKTTTGESWSWAPDEKCMTGAEAIRLLVDVVTKGGNLLLNIGPGPDGRWPEDAHRLLAEIGTWMKHNGEGIYATRTVPGWSLGPVRLVRQRHTGVHYLHALEAPSKTDGASSMRLDLPGTTLSESGSIRLLGSDAPLAVRRTSEGLYIDLPPSVRVNGVHWPVCVLRIEGLSVQSKPEVAP